MEWDLNAFIIRSGYRKKVFFELSKPQRPSQIAKTLDLRITHVTRVLRELKQKNLIKCLNPKESFGRFYELTPKGENVLKEVKKLTQSYDGKRL
ncbi:ArsR family transcriptional regulator [Candidatus Woesearchaeota archaeon]|nr:ArsR family transcriptional regulator [Candidatus Woesearchaeota archaeon]